MARNAGEPTKAGPAGAARWADYLDWARSELVDGVLALRPEQQRTTVVPSDWTPIELLSHVLHMEQRWIVWGFLGENVEKPWGDWTVEEPWDADADGRWHVPEDVTAEELAQRLDLIATRSRQILREHPLDSRSSPGGRFTEDPPTLEWICFHVLAEYARHAGQFDVVAELSAASR